MGESILVAISKIVVEKFGVKEALKKVGEEALKAFVWAPLTEAVKKFFVSKQEAEKFVQEISTREVVNVKKPCRDVEDVYEEMGGKESSEELYLVVENFLKTNQGAVRNANIDGLNNGMYIDGVNNYGSGNVNISYGMQINTMHYS